MTRKSAPKGASTISPPSSTDRNRTARARLEAASLGLAHGLLDPGPVPFDFYGLAAVTLIDAALVDLEMDAR